MLSRILFMSAITCTSAHETFGSDITFCQETCTCPPLPMLKKLLRVHHFLCTRNVYVSAITRVQETFKCPPLPVYKKLVCVRHSLCTKSCKCAPYPFFCNLSVPDNTCVWESQSAVLGCIIPFTHRTFSVYRHLKEYKCSSFNQCFTWPSKYDIFFNVLHRM